MRGAGGVINLDTLEMTDDIVMVADGQYTVATAKGLENLAELVNRDGSGDAENYTVEMLGSIDLQNKEWTPIGNSNRHLFQGTFDGQGHTVKNLKITNGSQHRLVWKCEGRHHPKPEGRGRGYWQDLGRWHCRTNNIRDSGELR